jgi:hypothetical protein
MIFALTTSQQINLQGLTRDEYANAIADVMMNGLISEADEPEKTQSNLAGQEAVAGHQQIGRTNERMR